MTREINQDRVAMEDAFFAQGDDSLLDELESAIAHGERKQQMMDAFGITDSRVVEQLLALELGDKTVAAISLVPLVQVAWADGKLQEAERRALLSAAEQNGLKPWSLAFRLLKNWLDQPPSPSLVDTWKAYMRALTKDMDGEQRAFLKQQFLGRAEQIAAAAGGFMLRIGSVSEAEQATLDDLASVFSES